MSSLESIVRFVVPLAIVETTDMHLRDAGKHRCECFVLWTGVREGDSFHIQTVHLPKQTAYRFEDGLCVRVDGAELHRLNVWLFDHGEELAVQVHSHPTDAFHSDTDDTFPIVTMRGGLSIVVPDFAVAGLRGRGTACYRLSASRWEELSEKQTDELLFFKG